MKSDLDKTKTEELLHEAYEVVQGCLHHYQHEEVIQALEKINCLLIKIIYINKFTNIPKESKAQWKGEEDFNVWLNTHELIESVEFYLNNLETSKNFFNKDDYQKIKGALESALSVLESSRNQMNAAEQRALHRPNQSQDLSSTTVFIDGVVPSQKPYRSLRNRIFSFFSPCIPCRNKEPQEPRYESLNNC